MINYHLATSKKRKQKVFDGILKRDIQNDDVVNVHCTGPNNVGDFYCGPRLYFDKLKGKGVNIFGFRSLKKSVTRDFSDHVVNKKIIIGGGGLLNINTFKWQMSLFEKLADKGKKVVVWGAGHNEKSLEDFKKHQKYWYDLSKFGLVGTRDYSMPFEWVPCVSCLHPIFDQTFEEKNDIGILFNTNSFKDKNFVDRFTHYPFSSNTTNLEEMISFIGSCRTLVTNSYHAMYWAILMGKKVVAIPATSKFLDFKYKVPIASFDDFEDHLNKTESYTGVLEECREINLNFAEKVFDYLEL
jgi:polysaccharide pyruvyl transferase WcaK-like protein